MKKIIAFVFLFMLVGVSASFASHHGGGGAQCTKSCKQCQWGPEKQEEYIQNKMKKLTSTLELSSSQQGEVEPILRDKMEKKKIVKQRTKDDMKQISDEFKSKMESVLDESQKPAFDEMMAANGSKKCKKKKKFFFF